MGFKPLDWYCRPVKDGVWSKTAVNAFGAYTPCGINSLVLCISHLALMVLCIYRIWRIKKDLSVQRFRLRSNYYNYFLGLLAAYCAAEPLFRLVMGISVSNLDGEATLAPFEIVSVLIEALAWCTMVVMTGIETKVYICEFRWYVRFGVIYILIGEAVIFNLALDVREYYNQSSRAPVLEGSASSPFIYGVLTICLERGEVNMGGLVLDFWGRFIQRKGDQGSV
ncbi:ABC transporter C family member 1 [Acorus gramineus]|uniref:ABC transporter C family member 1 n=1 Tax=Acorus gramineus TaxID=55184 RepID=A0AAV8ZYX7_ACOGR|nr:ABC transporter C family member 1 [Acorus gramineus]